MSFGNIALVLALLLGLAAAASADPELKPDPLAAASVMSFGAKADGKTDDTKAFQKALDAAAAKGGVVLAPAGTYLIAGALEVPQGVTLRGVWEAPHHSDIGKGTLILATGGAGDDKGKPLIHLGQSACAKGLTIMYPDQRAEKPIHYPWTITGEGMHCSVINVTLVNSYRGIKFTGELPYINNVYGCPFVVGIAIDGCTDIGRIENVHFNPHYWSRAAHPNRLPGDQAQKFFDWLSRNLIGFRIGRADWLYMNNCFVIFPKIGFHFIKTEGGEPNVVLTQCGADVCATAVQVDACQIHSGIAFSNSQIMSRVVVGPNSHGPVKFSNCGFWPIDATRNQALLEGHGEVTFTGCHFWDWGIKTPEDACIHAKNGGLIVNSCDLMNPTKPQIRLEEGVESAVITGNRLRGGARIVNNSKGDAQIGLNSVK